MFDVTKNNWLLDSTLSAPSYSDQVVFDIHTELTKTPIFDEMQRSFWFEHFCDKHYKTLEKYARQLGLEQFHDKGLYVQVLVGYFHRLVHPRGEIRL